MNKKPKITRSFMDTAKVEKLYNEVSNFWKHANFVRFHKNFFYYEGELYIGSTNTCLKINIDIQYLNEDYGIEMPSNIPLPEKFSDLIDMYKCVKIVELYSEDYWEQDLYKY
jgi:hypothetical protein